MGMGGGFGWGFGGFSQVPKPEASCIRRWSTPVAIRTSRHADVYANNPNSYINHIRDNGFVERYDVARQRSLLLSLLGPALAASEHGDNADSHDRGPAAAVVALASFYNAGGQIVWPADAPTAGDLKEKRARLRPGQPRRLEEAKKSGVASIATVTDARQKLLDYGRPGLQYVRTHETPRVADTYHLFLLSLYESLAQAVNPPARPPLCGPDAVRPGSEARPCSPVSVRPPWPTTAARFLRGDRSR